MSFKSHGALKASAKPFVPQDTSSNASLGNISHSPSHVQPLSTARNEVKKNKKFSSASGLLSFQFERPIHESPTAPVRKSHVNHRQKILTKAQYLQAKFILSPFTSPLETCFYDPDVIIPWETVVCVIVPPESDDAVSESSTLVCPVCLDAPRVPRMTKCGHTYCYPCLLRHMSNDRSNRNKCPMCSEIIDHDDLKPIQHSKVESVNRPPVGSQVPFQLIEVHKGNISVHKANAKGASLSSSAMKLADVIPSVSDVSAPYCRVISASVEFIRELFVDQLRQVSQYKQLCRNEHQLFDAGDVEAIPYLDEAESYIGAAKRKFEAKLLQEIANGNVPDVDDDSVAKAVITVNNLSIIQDLGCTGSTSGVTDVSSVFRASKTNGATSTSNQCSNSTSLQLYQKTSGELVYLHPLCTKCITTPYSQPLTEGSTEMRILPDTFVGTVVDVEIVRITAEIKQRYSILRHLPLYAVVSLIEIDLIGLVDNSVLAMFDQELHKRALKRMEKQKKEKRERKQDEDKRLAEELIKADRIAHYRALKEKQDRDIQQLLSGPAVGSLSNTNDTVEENTGNAAEEVSEASISAPETISFAEVTLMGGSFPTLSSSATKSANSGTASGSLGAWGKPKVEPKSPATGSVSSSESGSWMRGAQVPGGGDACEESGPNGKRGKKFTKVSLLSNSSSRSYR